MKELKDEISRLHAENVALQQCYDAARMEIESLKARLEPAGEYPPLPDFDSGDESIWNAIFKWEVATPGSDAHRKANAIESAIIAQLRDYVDSDRAMRAQAAPACKECDGTGTVSGSQAHFACPQCVAASRVPRTSICTRQVPAAVCLGVAMDWGDDCGDFGGAHCAKQCSRRTVAPLDPAQVVVLCRIVQLPRCACTMDGAPSRGRSAA